MVAESVRAKLDLLPPSPGVYVFRGHDSEVLYVGKARSLRARVRSYFQEHTSDFRAFIARLDDELGDLETYLVSTEKEAALLENQLIKEHRPRYNVRLRDDKDYLSLRLDLRRDFPRLQVVRRPKNDGAQYFGPYDSASGARQTLRLINRHFQLRTCTDQQMQSRDRPCLQYQIRRCPAPCVGKIDASDYAEQVRSVALFLQGRHDELLDAIRGKMAEASATLEYERAAVFRDQLVAVERVREQQSVVSVRDRDEDVVGLFRQADQAEVALLVLREGKLTTVRTFGFAELEAPDDELLAAFVSQYYETGSAIPDEVLVPRTFEAMEGLAELLSERRGLRVSIRVPQRGGGRKLLAMAEENASHSFREKRRSRDDLDRRLKQIQEALRLDRLPRTIECIDISHLGGDDTFAAIVRLEEGAPAPHRYRSFRLRTTGRGDDYGAIAEALERRFTRASEPGWELPDLLLIDGGRGQLHAAIAAATAVHVRDLPIASLAKEAERLSGRVEDRVYLPNRKNPVPLRSKPALSMLALARDEAHRFSNEARKRSGRKRLLRSDLDAIAHVGPKTKQRLLEALGSVSAIATADEATLRSAGATRAQASAIVAYFEERTTALPTSMVTEPEGAALHHGSEGREDAQRALRAALGLDPDSSGPDSSGPDSSGPDSSGPDPSDPDPSDPDSSDPDSSDLDTRAAGARDDDRVEDRARDDDGDGAQLDETARAEESALDNAFDLEEHER